MELLSVVDRTIFLTITNKIKMRMPSEMNLSEQKQTRVKENTIFQFFYIFLHFVFSAFYFSAFCFSAFYFSAFCFSAFYFSAFCLFCVLFFCVFFSAFSLFCVLFFCVFAFLHNFFLRFFSAFLRFCIFFFCILYGYHVFKPQNLSINCILFLAAFIRVLKSIKCGSPSSSLMSEKRNEKVTFQIHLILSF